MSKELFTELRERDSLSDDLNKRQPSFYRIDLATVQPTKGAIQPMMEAMLQAVEEGQIAPEQMLVKLKFLIEVFGEVCSNLTDAVRLAAERNKEPMQVLGAKIELAELGVKYDYSKDEIWTGLQAHISPLKMMIAERETFLKAVKCPMEVVNDLTGEVIKVVPPVKTSKSSVKVTLGQ